MGQWNVILRFQTGQPPFRGMATVGGAAGRKRIQRVEEEHTRVHTAAHDLPQPSEAHFPQDCLLSEERRGAERIQLVNTQYTQMRWMPMSAAPFRGLVAVGRPTRRQSVQLVKEEHAGMRRPRAPKQLPHRPLGFSDVLVQQLRALKTQWQSHE